MPALRIWRRSCGVSGSTADGQRLDHPRSCRLPHPTGRNRALLLTHYAIRVLMAEAARRSRSGPALLLDEA
ncbi:hypothetical protein FRAHR75_950017 [Frankia sp. Hr75.2]|nr:hypothetical protein FRAHR75_950017 [Frankia sp. Hr75.2]